MTREEHLERHALLHQHLDELVADFIAHAQCLPSRTTALELMRWSAKQTTDIDHEDPTDQHREREKAGETITPPPAIYPASYHPLPQPPRQHYPKPPLAKLQGGCPAPHPEV